MARISAILNLGMNSPNQCTVHDNERIIVRKYPSRDTLTGHMGSNFAPCQPRDKPMPLSVLAPSAIVLLYVLVGVPLILRSRHCQP